MSAKGSTSTITDQGVGSARSIDDATSIGISTVTHKIDNTNVFVDLDTETSTLIAELLYSDLEELTLQRKGKARHDAPRNDAPRNDAEYALQIQSEQLERMLMQIQDAEIAKRMQDAMRMDQGLIEQMVLNEQAARQDREAALALSRGQRLPAPTKEQRAVEQGARMGNNEP